MRKVYKYIKNPKRLYLLATSMGLTNSINDESHLKRVFKIRLGYELDLVNPRTYNEKLQWLKLHDRNPMYTIMVDKYLSKQWAASIIGEEYIVPAYAMWERAEDIDISELPNQFVLKTNHDCGGVVICRDKSTFDLDSAKKKLAKHLKRNYFYSGREWPYKNVKPVVFAEKYLAPDVDGAASDLIDYKFMCFDGNARSVFTCSERTDNLSVDFFDMHWNHLPFIRHYPNAKVTPTRPKNFMKMRDLAERLCAGIPFVRVDFFESDGKCYLGEMTFYPGSGCEEFIPGFWDEKFGQLIDLSGAYCYKDK